MRRCMLASAVGLVLVAQTLAACGGDDDGGGDGFEQRPIVFLHGCPPPPFNNHQMANLWTGNLIGMPDRGTDDFYFERGYPEDHINIFVYDGETCPPIYDYAAQVDDYFAEVLERTGESRVDLIAFSAGVMAGRAYLNMGGTEHVEDFVSIAGANHGSVLAGMIGEAGQSVLGYPSWEGAFEINPAYACEGESGPSEQFREEFPSESSNEDVQFELNGCLTESGRTVEVDETPQDVDEGGHIRYLAIWNDLDDVVSPAESACLNQASQRDCSDPVNMQFSVSAMTELAPPDLGVFSAHVETTIHEPILQTVYDFVTSQ